MLVHRPARRLELRLGAAASLHRAVQRASRLALGRTSLGAADLAFKPGDFPISEAASQESLALPIYPELTSEMIETVCRVIDG